MNLQALLFLGFLLLLVAWRVIVALTPKGAEKQISGLGKAIRPLIVIAALGSISFVGWVKYQEWLPQKTIENLFSYLDKGEYEKAYSQYSSKFHDQYSMSLDGYIKGMKGIKNYEFNSIKFEPLPSKVSNDAILEQGLSAMENALPMYIENFSFLDYKNKKLFKVKYYSEDPNQDMQLNQSNNTYCSEVGVFTDAFFGMVQIDAFSWEILFFCPTDFQCKGKNKYADYKAAEKVKLERKKAERIRKYKEQQEAELNKIQLLNTLRLRFKNECPSKFKYIDVPKYEKPQRRTLDKNLKAEWAKKRKSYNVNSAYLEDYKRQIDEYCVCLFDEVKDNASTLESLLNEDLWRFIDIQWYEDDCGNKPKQIYIRY